MWVDDQHFSIERSMDIEWEGLPQPQLLELLDTVYQDARNAVQNAPAKAPF
ncbi:hypothetical protein SEA_ZOOMAN_179 [Microbacterium phage Zooman]|nr:hypothetical protein SEA_ZOOMAN_179 [Microbacterium phage Zooman]